MQSFVKEGTVLQHSITGEFLFATGLVHDEAHTAWGVEVVRSKTEDTFFTLAKAPSSQGLRWLLVLDWTTWQVIPTRPASPAQQFLLQRKRLSPVAGVVLAMTGPPTALLNHAAEHCFWRISMAQLSKLATDLGVVPEGHSVLDLLVSLLDRVLGPLDEARRQELLQMRCLARPNPLPPDLQAEDVEDLLGKEHVKEVEELTLRS